MAEPNPALPAPDRQRHTAGRAFVRIFFALSLAWFVLPLLVTVVTTTPDRWFGRVPAEAHLQLRSIKHRLDRGAADDMQRLFPEGRIFAWSFYGLSLVNMATADPTDAEFRRHAVAELEALIPVVAEQAHRSPFHSPSEPVVPEGGVIPAGHVNLLRAGYLLLGGDSAPIELDFHDLSATLYGEFMASPTGSLETYAGLVWPVDNVFALESLRLHDVLYDTEYGEAGVRWADWLSEHRDPATGMMVSWTEVDGSLRDDPRGCALSWSLAVMPGFAPDFAAEQYARYRADWFVHVLGSTGIREWPPGTHGGMDADTGPIVGGIGAAASGLGIAAARANGDGATLARLLRAMEVLSVPATGPRGKSYFLGQVLLADELALWGKTIRVWDQPPSDDVPAAFESPSSLPFWLLFGIVAVASLGLVFLAGRTALRSVQALWRSDRRLSPASGFVLALHLGVVGAWLLSHAVLWPMAAAAMAGVDLLEWLLVRRRGKAWMLDDPT